MNLFEHYSDEDISAVHASAGNAQALLCIEGTAVLDKVNKKRGETPNQAYARLRLYHLRLSTERDLSEDPWPWLVELAARENNKTFFISLGKILGSRPIKRPSKRPKVDWFLATHWAIQASGIPVLACLTWEGLTEVCSLKCGKQTLQSIRMRVKRLGLKRFPKPYFAVESLHPKIALREV